MLPKPSPISISANAAGSKKHFHGSPRAASCAVNCSIAMRIIGGKPDSGVTYSNSTALPLAQPAMKRNVSTTAASSRYIVTPSQLNKAGAPGSKPARASPSARLTCSKSTGTKRSERGSAMPASRRRACFHLCVAGKSTSKRRPGASGCRYALVSSPAPRTTYWRTPRPMASARMSSASRLRTTTELRMPNDAG